jgi:hypothetical protein
MELLEQLKQKDTLIKSPINAAEYNKNIAILESDININH